ncbi:cation:proton antiporter [Micromonospora sp. DT81.3]|uniref:cation:proton antiporter n=1 Tax=Micromonospora sp. DT81.3 TaxID=3416523 RepID=UPI003CF6853B
MEPVPAVLSLVVLGWAVLSRRLAGWNITGPVVLSAAGFLLGNQAWGPVPVDVDAPSVHLLVELTLALLLFSDASRVNLPTLRRDVGIPARLLGIGLPASVLLGTLAAALLFNDLTWALALFVGAALAPTDAALSTQVIEDERVPARVRRALNIESGLNDGIVTPIVVFALALAATQLGHSGEDSGGVGAGLELVIGIAIGVVLGFVSAKLLAGASRRGWVIHGGRRLGALATAVGSFALAEVLGGNAFIAAFVAGMAFGAAFPPDVAAVDEVVELPELLGEVLALGVWFLFGAALVPFALEHVSLATLAYAVLSLTIIRMLPVAVGLAGTGLDTQTVGFIGWFGPRGLASVVFAILAIEQLGEFETVGPAISVVAVTVLLSVLAHGVSAGPLVRRYARSHGDGAPGGHSGPRARRRGA